MDRKLARQIAQRARGLFLQHGVARSKLEIEMDVVATHCNGNPLRLKDLLSADDFNLLHDVGGIFRHLDRESGALQNCFRPRFSVPETRA